MGMSMRLGRCVSRSTYHISERPSGGASLTTQCGLPPIFSTPSTLASL
jgi:hypothetical protein